MIQEEFYFIIRNNQVWVNTVLFWRMINMYSHSNPIQDIQTVQTLKIFPQEALDIPIETMAPGRFARKILDK